RRLHGAGEFAAGAVHRPQHLSAVRIVGRRSDRGSVLAAARPHRPVRGEADMSARSDARRAAAAASGAPSGRPLPSAPLPILLLGLLAAAIAFLPLLRT